MRPDLPKRFTETKKRSKGKFPRGNKSVARKHDTPPKGMRRFRAAAKDRDELSGAGTDFHLLDRFLMANKGRPWDDVYSDICRQSDPRSFNGHHFRSWLDYRVEQNCAIGDDGKVYDHRGFPISLYWKTFYVHPDTGILTYVPKGRYRFELDLRRKNPAPLVFELEGKLYHNHGGIWYRVEMQEVADTWGAKWICGTSGIDDVFEVVHNWTQNPWMAARMLRNKYGLSPKGKIWYCTKKQSANSGEIRRIRKLYLTPVKS